MQSDLSSREVRSDAAPSELEIIASVNVDHVPTLDQISKKYIFHVFNLNNGAREKTAKDLKIDRKTLYRKLQEIQSEN
jgi:DNA-binding NtrC family response regulator